jgi:hypothetical protein
MYSLFGGALIIFPQRIIFHFYWKNGLLTHLMISGICCLVIVILDKMTEKDIVNNLDAPLKIKSRLDCIDEFYRFSQERIACYETLDKKQTSPH